jgi:hypothetical protein
MPSRQIVSVEGRAVSPSTSARRVHMAVRIERWVALGSRVRDAERKSERAA